MIYYIISYHIILCYIVLSYDVIVCYVIAYYAAACSTVSSGDSGWPVSLTLGGTTCLTLPVYYGLICFRDLLSCQGSS